MPTAPIIQPDASAIAQAAELIRAGKLVAFPTETVYGLGGDATNDNAVAAIYAAKGRPQFNPLIIHVADLAELDDLVTVNDTARLLAQQFWPGPLTLVLPRKTSANISLLASAGLDTLAVRVPKHPVALQLLRAAKTPIAAPSANASGKLSPTTPMHVADSLGDKLDLILAGGKTQVGVESTVLNLTTPQPTLLRHGGIPIETLQDLIGPITDATMEISGNPASPGMLAAHYAPNLPLRLNATGAEPDETLLTFGPDLLVKGGGMRLNLSPDGDLQEAAANLFAMLRQLDHPGMKGIAVVTIPNTGLGRAINDRLKRASIK